MKKEVAVGNIMKLFWSLDPILVGRGWSIAITPWNWGITKGIDSIGRYVRIGPIILEYNYNKNIMG